MRHLISLETALLLAKYDRELGPLPDEDDAWEDCRLCNSTGEGVADGLRCPACKGQGRTRKRGRDA
jgi:hypothetical protein